MSVATASASAEQTGSRIPENQVIVLFGATGDLAKRKLLPGMFHLAQVGLMPRQFRIIGAARHEVDLEEFREFARQAIEASGREDLSPATWDPFAESLRFVGVGDGFEGLGEAVADAREDLGEEAGILYYLSLPPQAAAGTVEQLGASGIGGGGRVSH
jgi:glucose-6-phosphate 1-dehydrogenase